jgi:hypothetical protein
LLTQCSGYTNSGPASPELSVYDSSTGEMTDSWTPPFPVGGGSGGGGDNSGSSDSGGSSTTGGSGGGGGGGGGSTGVPDPTAEPGSEPGSPATVTTSVWTPINTIPGQTHVSGGSAPTGTNGSPTPTSTGGGGDGGNGDDDGDDGNGDSPADPPARDTKRITAIAVGTAFGLIGFLGVLAAIFFLVRRRRRDQRLFHALGGDDPDNSPTNARGSPATTRSLPLAAPRSYREKSYRPTTLLQNIRKVSSPIQLIAAARMRATPERRNMLDDEDTREFGGLYDRRPGMVANDSSWSLKSILGGMKSRQPSTSSVPRSYGGVTREKSDPFSDGASLLQDNESGYVGAAAGARPEHRRGMTSSTAMSAESYLDPFSDPPPEANPGMALYRNAGNRGQTNVSSTRSGPDLHLQTVLPVVNNPRMLSPVTESSRNTLSLDESTSQSSHSQAQSQDRILSPFDTISQLTSRTSNDYLSPRTSSLIDQPPQPIRRSDSWWTRFSRTSFLDRRTSDRRSGGMPEIRDPHPPPRLVAIEESQHSASPENDSSPESKRNNSIKRGQSALARAGSKMSVRGQHGKSQSSLQTFNSEALEKMGGMNIARRERTSSHNTRGSTGSTHLSLETEDAGDKRDSWIQEDWDKHEGVTYSSPTDGAAPVGFSSPWDSGLPASPPSPLSISLPSPSPIHTSSSHNSTPPAMSSVAAQIQDYEKRTSPQEEIEPPQSPKSKARRKSHVDYGLVPRPNLFVANPDHK